MQHDLYDLQCHPFAVVRAHPGLVLWLKRGSASDLDTPFTIIKFFVNSCAIRNLQLQISLLYFGFADSLLQKIAATASAPTEAQKSNMVKTHNAGAAALVMHRGQENCKSPLSVGLLFSVRSQLVSIPPPETDS